MATKVPRTLLVFAHATGAALVIAIAILAVTFGPGMETAISPVVRITKGPVEDLYRDETKACFSLNFTKLARAAPVKYLFFVETQSSLPISLSWYMADRENHHIGYDLENHDVGTSWKRHYCFDTPGTVGDWQVMTVTGEALHRRNPFWITRTPTPVIDICPSAQGLNGGCPAT